MKNLQTNILHQPVQYNGITYFTSHYFHSLYRNVNGGENYKELFSFNRLIRSIETYREYVERGDIVEVKYEENRDSVLESPLKSNSYNPIMLISATAQLALSHHLDDEISKKISVSVNVSASEAKSEKRLDAEHALNMEMMAAEFAARMLKVSETSKIRMMRICFENHEVSTKLLPSYSDEQLTRSATYLLKEHGALNDRGKPLTAITFNKKLIEGGYLESLMRPSIGGKTKQFKSLTEKGLQYGKNETSPENPRQTQPMFFAVTFEKLLVLISE